MITSTSSSSTSLRALARPTGGLASVSSLTSSNSPVRPASSSAMLKPRVISLPSAA